MVNRVGGIYPGQEQFGLDQGDGQVINIKVVKLRTKCLYHGWYAQGVEK